MSFAQKMKLLNLTPYELERRIRARENEHARLGREIKTLKALKKTALEAEQKLTAAQ
jgi:hypothetical protein